MNETRSDFGIVQHLYSLNPLSTFIRFALCFLVFTPQQL